MWVIQWKVNRAWQTIGGKFPSKGEAELKISQYAQATTTHLQSREYRTKRI